MDGMMTGGLPLTDGMSLAWALGVALKTTALLTVTGLLTLALFRSSAALRHLLWSLAIGGVLVLPFIPLASPWSWEVLPELGMVSTAEQPAAAAAAAPTATTPKSTTVTKDDDAMPAAGGGSATAATDGTPVITDTSAGVSLPWGPIALVTWATGALLLIVHQLVGRTALRRITEEAEPVDDAEVRWELAWSAGVSRPVRVLRSDRVRVPMTWGVRRPVVLLPSESRDWSAERVRLVLHHELAHVRRMDALTDLGSRIACALHWFNPMVWWAAARLRSESEKASDDLVLESGARASEYAGHLLDIVTNLTHRRAPAGAIPLAQKSEFEGRLLAILDPSRERSGVGRASALALGAVLLTAVVAIGSVAPAQAAVTAIDPPADIEVVAAAPSTTDGGNLAVAAITSDATAEPRRSVDVDEGGAENPAAPSPSAGPAQGDVDERVDPGAEAGREPEESEVAPVQLMDTTSVRALTQALRGDANAEVRRTAAWALGQIEDPAATAALSDALRDDESTDVRRMAAWALGQIEDPAAAPALGEALGDEDAEVRESALWALGQIESPEAVGPLTRALSDADPGARKTAAWALGQIGSRESVEPLTRALRDEDVEVRRQAAWALGQVESASAVDALSQALREDADTDVRRQSAWALGQIEADSAVPALVDALSDADPEVARMAAWALGQIEPSSAPPELVEAARSGTGNLRATALWALVRIEDPAAVPALVDALQDEDAELRGRALRGLADIGSDVAIEAIAELLQDPDPEVRAAAARALAGGRGGWSSPRPNPNPNPRPRPNGRADDSDSEAIRDPGTLH